MALVLVVLGTWCSSWAQDDIVKSASIVCNVRVICLKGCEGEENWSSAAVTSNGRLLVGMSSRKANAVLLDVEPSTGKYKQVLELGKVGHWASIQRQPKIHVNPVMDTKGNIQFLSHCGLDSHIPFHGSRVGYEGMRRWRWNPTTNAVDDLGVVFPGEGAIALNASSDGRRLFVVTFPQALLLEVDSETGELLNYGRTNGSYAPRNILVDPWDNPYVLDHKGRFWSVVGQDKQLSPLEAVLPVSSRISGNLLSQGFVACQPFSGRKKWLAMSAWGELYQVEFATPGQVHVTSHGYPANFIEAPHWKPPNERLVTAAALAKGPDGWVYIGISGYNRAVDSSGDSYIIRFDPKKRISEIVARLSGKRVSYLCGGGLVDPKGERAFFLGCHLIHDNPCVIVLEGLQRKES